MKKIIVLLGLMVCSAAMASPKIKWLTVDNQILSKIKPKLNKSVQVLFSSDTASVIQMTLPEIEALAGIIHSNLHRCGGFITHDSFEEAQTSLTHLGESYFAQKAIFSDYSINQAETVKPMVAQVEEKSIRDMIIKLSSFKTRYYKSPIGQQSSEFIRDTWVSLSKHRSDVKVELIKHKNWPQPSIVMTVAGSESPEEIVVLGGHVDSIQVMFGVPIPNGVAPGADDNASGISTITEVIRILMTNNFKPKRTIQFMGYAAEEVGLLGSHEIAASYRQKSKKVIGVIQFDMTLNKGSKDQDIVMMSDFTNASQNEFLGRLIDEYVKVPWGYSKCGYGCSDHASWTNSGFPASMPFESTMEDINHAIHSKNDTLQTAGGDAKHSAKFAKLATAFIVEMAN